MKRIEIIQKESAHVGLLEEERKHMRESLLAYMDKTPAAGPEDASLFVEPTRSRYSKLFVLAIAAGLIVATTGVTFAASQSLPGDLLYPVKVGINEKVMGYMAFSDEKKAEFEAHVTTRRLQEAQALEARADKSPERWAELRENINTHIAAYEHTVEKLKITNNQAAVNVDSSFKSSLTSYAAVLPALSLNTQADVQAAASTTPTEATTSALTQIIGTNTALASTTQELNTSIQAEIQKPKVPSVEVKTNIKGMLQ